MKRKILRISFVSILLFLSVMILNLYKVKAASASISCSNTTVGTSTKISVSGSAAQWNLSLQVNETTIASNSELDNYLSNKTISFSGSYTPTATGTYMVSLVGTITDIDGTTTRSFASKSFTVSEATSNNTGNGTSNNTGGDNGGGTTNTTTTVTPRITNLGITPSEYDFSGFASTWTTNGGTYYVSVPNEVTSITIYANTNDGGTATGTGKQTLSEGTNKFKVSYGNYYYYISVTRGTLASEEEPANHGDEEVIGLASLSIEGYEFEEEFDANTYTYTVKLEKELTEEELNEIMEKIDAKVNSDNEEIKIRTEGNITEDGEATITIYVEDEEKAYSVYYIKFTTNEIVATPAIGSVGSTTTKGVINTSGNSGLSLKQMCFFIIGALLFTEAMVLVYAIISYVQHKKLLGPEEEEFYEEDFEEESPKITEDELPSFLKAKEISKGVEENLETPSPVKSEILSGIKENGDILKEPEAKKEEELPNESTLERALKYERRLFNLRSQKPGRVQGKH